MLASEKFGRRIRAARALAGLTQKDLAAALGVTAPCHYTTVSLWESGQRAPGLAHFILLCQLFDWSGDERATLEKMLLDGAEA